MLWGAIAIALAAFAQRLEPGGGLRRVLIAYAGIGVPVIALHTAFAAWWTWWSHPDRLAGLRTLPLDGPRFVNQLPIDLLAYCAIAGALLAIRAWQRAARSERLADQARVRAIEAQLQPHFLFNALQAISTLIGKNPDAASEMVNTLSNLLRRSLCRDLRVAIPLADELELAGDYLAIQQVRFRDRLAVTRQIDPAALRCAVPPLLLQPLLENAFVHGIEQVTGPVTLFLEASVENGVLRIEIANDGPAPAAGAEGIGLTSVRERLRHAHGAAAALELHTRDHRTVARITLPAIMMEQS